MSSVMSNKEKTHKLSEMYIYWKNKNLDILYSMMTLETCPLKLGLFWYILFQILIFLVYISLSLFFLSILSLVK